MSTRDNGTVVLSALEFGVVWEAERLPRPHVALSTASPGETHAERTALVDSAWNSLTRRGLARRGKASGDLVDQLNLLAHSRVAIDAWVWADREISALAVSAGGQGLLGVLDGDEVWLIPTRASTLPEAAVSVIGELAPGEGRSVSVPHESLRRADSGARGEPAALITALEDRGVALAQAQELAGMLAGQQARGQFGAQRTSRDAQVRRARRVVSFFDSEAGRYLFQLDRNSDGRDWATIAPADSYLLVDRVRELLDEV